MKVYREEKTILFTFFFAYRLNTENRHYRHFVN